MNNEWDKFLSKTEEALELFKVPNLIRGLMVLELLRGHPDGLSVTEIGQLMELPKNSTFRVLMTINHLGYLNLD